MNSELIEIRSNDDEKLFIETDEQGRGKLIHYLTASEKDVSDGFTVSVSSESIARLRENSSRKVFKWRIKDKSLEIDGSDGQWNLHLYGIESGIVAHVYLSKAETEHLSSQLFETV